MVYFESIANVLERLVFLPGYHISIKEASDLMEIAHVTFDQNLKLKMTRSRGAHSTGPFYQIVAYQFGSFRILVRFEVDCADYAAVKCPPLNVDASETLPERKKAAENEDIQKALIFEKPLNDNQSINNDLMDHVF
ncbi:hypothetical protein DICVIV_11719 [Dictyocaulus viviparus]|uniref:Uncharacterized protein n=1 Tax=Dictyocaulus viviparus TaxID=29172 RepID=A0A0D8XCG4_DICVI|nr:hypothetical protein DICVIV_11719 [Dictyocaulus viviparus]